MKESFRKLLPPFDAEMQTKAFVAGAFLRDGDDLFELASVGWESDRDNRSYRSKVFVNLSMTMECYLKSLIVSLSQPSDSPEAAYRKARQPRHDLGKLVEVAEQSNAVTTGTPLEKAGKPKSQTQLVPPEIHRLIKQIEDLELDVGLRYEVDMVRRWWEEDPIDEIRQTGKMSRTVGSDSWMRNSFRLASALGDIANNAFHLRLGAHTGCWGTHLKAKSRRIRAFFAQLPGKKTSEKKS